MSIILKIFKYIFLSTAAIAVTAVIFIETGYFKGLLKNVLTSQIGLLSKGSFTVEKLGGNIFTGMTLEGIQFSGTEGRIFYAEKIDASYSLPALIRGRAYFTDVVISKPFFTIAQNSAGHWNYEGLFPKSKSGTGISVMLSELRIKDGRVSIKYRDKPEVLDITDVNLSASAIIKNDTSEINFTELRAKSAKLSIALKNISGSVQVKGPAIKISKLTFSTEYSKGSIDGTITDMVRPVFNLNIECPKISLKDIGALVPGIRPSGMFSTNIKITGGLDELKVVQSIEYNSLKIYNEAIFCSDIPSVVLNSKIHGFKPCELMPIFAGYEKETCPKGELSMDVRIQAKGSNFDELRSSACVYIHSSSFAGLNIGESTLTAVIDKRAVSLEGQLEIAREIIYLSALGKTGDKVFRLDKLNIRSSETTIASKGVFGYSNNAPLDMPFNIKSAGLRLVSVILPDIKIGGFISSTGTIKGTLGSPKIIAELSGRDIYYSEFSAGSIKAKIGLDNFKLPPDGIADIQMTGFHTGGTAFNKISVSAKNSNNIIFLALSAEKNTAEKFYAETDVTQKSKGLYLVNIKKMKVLAATSTWSNDGNITMEISKQQVQVQALKLSNGSQIISAKGIIGLVENMNMKLKIENADVSGFLALAGLDLPLGGNLNAEIGVEGSYLLPHISGSVNVRGAAAGGLSFDNIPSSFNYADKKLQFKTLAEKSGKTIFSAEGIIPVDLSFTTIKERLLHKGLSVSIKASGLGLDIVPMFSEQVKSSSGDMRADIHIEGDPYLPQISGNINISGGSLSLLATGADYRDINAGITLNGNEILLRELNLKSGSGSAKLTGKIMMKGFIPEDAELNLTCRNFNVMKTSLFTGDIDSDITIKGLHASGTVTLDQGVVNIPSQSKAQLSEIEFVQAKPGGGTVKVPSVNEEPEFYKQLVLDVRVSIPGKAWVYGQSITVDVKGDFNVTKERNGPMLYDGEIDITRGFYKINERTLNITDGRILARKDVFMSSFINAKASCKVGDVSIEVILGGTIDNPIITFTSEPPMERSEIISYLAFGAPSGKLSQPQSSALQNTSFDLVAGFAEKDIKGVVGRVVSIDELTIKPSEGSWGVGKYITDKLFAKYEWRSGLDESPQTVLDYMLDRHFSLNSQIGDPKTSGVDLFWKIGY